MKTRDCKFAQIPAQSRVLRELASGRRCAPGALSHRGAASADFLEARPPACRLDRRQHVAFALSRDRQRQAGVQKIEDAIFQRAPFIAVKLGMTEVTLVEKRQI